MAVCIPRVAAEQLRSAAKKGEITIEKMVDMTSAQRRNLIAKHIGKESARDINATFERALMSQQKQAMRQWVWKNFYNGKPLYRELTLAEAQKMRNAGLTMKELRKMSSEKRVDRIAEFVNRDTAITLNKRFKVLQKTGNLAHWEERAIGTRKMFEDRKLKGAFGRIEAIDDLGILRPGDTSKFMEDLVSMKLGVDIGVEEAAKISRLSRNVSKMFDNIGDNWGPANRKNVVDYYVKRKELQDFVESLAPASMTEVFTNVGARGAILASVASAWNSLMYQIIPGITTALTKRIGTANLLPGDMGKLRRMQIAMTSAAPNKTEVKFMWDYFKMNWEVYRKTGHDLSRMQTLDDGFRFFGEKFTHVNGPTPKQAQGVKEKMGAGARGHAKLMQPGLKYAAGGTDTVFATFHRIDTTLLLSKIAAKQEKAAGKLPKGVTVQKRAMEIAGEALSFDPKTHQTQYIREMGITDGHLANFTGNGAWGNFAVRVRDSLRIGDAGIGTIIMPFMRVPANAMGKGFESSGPALITGTKGLIKALRAPAGVDKNIAVAKELNSMISAAGYFGTAVFISSLINPEDFVGAYDWTKRSENAFKETKNAGSSYFRMGNKWYSTRWFGPVAVPFNGIMYARQARLQGKSALLGYGQGVLWGMAQFPLALEGPMDKIGMLRRAKDYTDAAKILGMTPERISKWFSVRMVPSFLTYDIYALRDTTRYDSLGRPIPQRGDTVQSAVTSFFVRTNIKEDTSNEITREFDQLLLKGHLPVLTDPTESQAKEYIERYGEEAYENHLVRLKQDYAREIERTIKHAWYKRLSAEEKKKEIDKIRRTEILNRI